MEKEHTQKKIKRTDKLDRKDWPEFYEEVSKETGS